MPKSVLHTKHLWKKGMAFYNGFNHIVHKLINIKYVPNYIYYILWVFQYFSAEKERIKEKKKDGKWKKERL